MARAAADRVAAGGVPDADWAAAIGSPTIGKCWHYSDVGGRQESVTVSFGYGTAEHALSVLIDHGNGGKIKDAWVDDADGPARQDLAGRGERPADRLRAARARRRRASASRRRSPAGERPSKPDEVDDLTAHRALLHARVAYLAAN